MVASVLLRARAASTNDIIATSRFVHVFAVHRLLHRVMEAFFAEAAIIDFYLAMGPGESARCHTL